MKTYLNIRVNMQIQDVSSDNEDGVRKLIVFLQQTYLRGCIQHVLCASRDGSDALAAVVSE